MAQKNKYHRLFISIHVGLKDKMLNECDRLSIKKSELVKNALNEYFEKRHGNRSNSTPNATQYDRPKTQL